MGSTDFGVEEASEQLNREKLIASLPPRQRRMGKTAGMKAAVSPR